MANELNKSSEFDELDCFFMPSVNAQSQNCTQNKEYPCT